MVAAMVSVTVAWPSQSLQKWHFPLCRWTGRLLTMSLLPTPPMSPTARTALAATGGARAPDASVVSDGSECADAVELRHVESAEELAACYPVMHELRPHLDSPKTFIERARRQQEQGWRLLAQWRGDVPVALAGYRWLDNLVHGRFIYVDDLVTTAGARGQRSGQALLSELKRLAKAGGAQKLVLDAAMANSRAHRFYFRSGLLATGLHFTEVLA